MYGNGRGSDKGVEGQMSERRPEAELSYSPFDPERECLDDHSLYRRQEALKPLRIQLGPTVNSAIAYHNAVLSEKSTQVVYADLDLDA